jgi:hypothetical protein
VDGEGKEMSNVIHEDDVTRQTAGRKRRRKADDVVSFDAFIACCLRVIVVFWVVMSAGSHFDHGNVRNASNYLSSAACHGGFRLKARSAFLRWCHTSGRYAMDIMILSTSKYTTCIPVQI